MTTPEPPVPPVEEPVVDYKPEHAKATEAIADNSVPLAEDVRQELMRQWPLHNWEVR